MHDQHLNVITAFTGDALVIVDDSETKKPIISMLISGDEILKADPDNFMLTEKSGVALAIALKELNISETVKLALHNMRIEELSNEEFEIDPNQL